MIKIPQIFIIAHSDYQNFPMGGIASYCQNILIALSNLTDTSAVGLIKNDVGKPGKWSTLSGISWSKQIRFLPILKNAGDGNISKRCPLKFRFSLALLKKIDKLARIRKAVFITNDIEVTLPLLFLQKRGRFIITVRHGIGDFIRKKKDHYLFKHDWLCRVYLWLESFILRRVDKVIVVSEEGLVHYQKKFPEMANKFVLIPSGVDLDIFKPQVYELDYKKEHGTCKLSPYIFTACRLEPEKGLDLLMKAFAILRVKHPNAILVIAGTGSQRTYLKELSKELGIENEVTFAGAIYGRELVKYYNRADVFALSSEWEGMPLAVLEALACGTPVVATNVGEISRVVISEHTGYLCQTRDADELACLLEKASLNKNRMSERCRSVASESSTRKMALQFLEIIKELVTPNN